ncbi:MAG: 50S ribosomal protein L11 methyltransferase [Betaproteobacteria bacterium]|nr:50S ribosomal protein L11 methyltransferase [Betaproteobacteria bacterium]
MAWLSITLELPSVQAETLSEALLEAGAESVSLEPTSQDTTTIEPGARLRVIALATTTTDPAALVSVAAAIAAIAPPGFTLATVEDQDWVRRSQSQFGPICVTEHLWIVPNWHTPPDPAAIVVRLDPGLAFGTGSHVSTRLVLRYLAKHIRGGERVLDYGCGSGILAIVAGKLGVGEIAATDIDPQALETTAANAANNGVALKVTAPESLPPGVFDLVLANILAGPLITLAPLLAGRTRCGGRIVLSGILETQAAEVALAYAKDFDIAVDTVEEGWALVAGWRK